MQVNLWLCQKASYQICGNPSKWIFLLIDFYFWGRKLTYTHTHKHIQALITFVLDCWCLKTTTNDIYVVLSSVNESNVKPKCGGGTRIWDKSQNRVKFNRKITYFDVDIEIFSWSISVKFELIFSHSHLPHPIFCLSSSFLTLWSQVCKCKY